MLIVMCGLPLTGKSTVAEHLSGVINAKIISTDSIRRELFRSCTLQEILDSPDPLKCDLQRVFDAQPSIPEKYQQMIWQQNRLVYDRLLRKAADSLSRRSVVLDGTFSRKSIRDRAYAIGRSASHDVYLIHCVCTDEVIVKRLSRRQQTPDQTSYVASLAVFQKVKERFEDPLDGDIPTIVYDSGTSLIHVRNAEMGNKEEIARLAESIAAQHR